MCVGVILLDFGLLRCVAVLLRRLLEFGWLWVLLLVVDLVLLGFVVSFWGVVFVGFGDYACYGLLLWFSLACALHDLLIGYVIASGWWILLVVIGALGLLWFFVLAVARVVTLIAGCL